MQGKEDLAPRLLHYQKSDITFTVPRRDPISPEQTTNVPNLPSNYSRSFTQ